MIWKSSHVAQVCQRWCEVNGRSMAISSLRNCVNNNDAIDPTGSETREMCSSLKKRRVSYCFGAERIRKTRSSVLDFPINKCYPRDESVWFTWSRLVQRQTKFNECTLAGYWSWVHHYFSVDATITKTPNLWRIIFEPVVAISLT